MQTIEVWTSLEIAKLLVSALTPVIVAILGIWIARMTKRLEQRQWTGQKIIERRINVYDEIAPLLNDLLVYFTFVGHWKEIRPPQIVESKRLLDRRVHVSASLFSDQFLSDYFSYINFCFKTYQGWGTDARLRKDPTRHIEAAGRSWNPAWDDMFVDRNEQTDPQHVRSAYQRLMKTLSKELQLGLQTRSIPSGRVPWDSARSNIVHQTMTAKPVSHDAKKPVKPFYFYRVLPQELRVSGSDNLIGGITSRKARWWPNGSTLRIHFLDGSVEQRDAVFKFAIEWTEYANLTFEFQDDLSAEIRITFEPTKGSWSYIGTDCLQIPYDMATMNLASVDKGTVLHLFGLALGLMFEYQNPAGGLKWNRDNVIRDLSVIPDYSSTDIADKFLMDLSVDQLNETGFDPESVMLMPIPDDWTEGKQSILPNKELSVRDKSLIARIYPLNR